MRWPNLFPALVCVALAIIASATAALDPADEAETYRVGDLLIVDPWVSYRVGGDHSARLFFEFSNRGEIGDKLIGARTPLATGPTLFKVVEAVDGERRTRQIDGIDIPALAHGWKGSFEERQTRASALE